MLTIKECSKTLNKKSKNKFTEEEIIKIREFLYKMAGIVVESKKAVSDER